MPSDNFLWFDSPATGPNLPGNVAKPKGESLDQYFGKGKKDALEINEFSFGVTQAESAGSATMGAGAGKVKFEEFSVKKPVDASSAMLYQACAAGAHFPIVRLAIRKAGGGALMYLEYIFKMVFVTGISVSGGGGEELPSEEIKFKFGAMGMQYVPQGPDGHKSGGPFYASWSVVLNKPDLSIAAGDPSPKFDDPDLK